MATTLSGGRRGVLSAPAWSLGIGMLLTLVPLAPAAAQQQDSTTNGRLGVFLDCEGRECREVQTFFRTEIDWVDWVRDREDSDVHVIVTNQRTGSGGTEYQLDFIGRRRLEAVTDQLFFRSLGTDVEQEEYDGLTTTLAIGLARYASLAGIRDYVAFQPPERRTVDPDARVVSPQEVEDPWNLWVFNVGASGRIEDTDREDTRRFSAELSASRTTPTWKLLFRVDANRNFIETLLSDSSIFKSTLTDVDADAQIVYSVADHWSVGIISSVAKEPRNNQDLRVQVLPALEYSVFPYPEATRRSLTARYAIGPTHWDYEEETIFERTAETHVQQYLQIRYSHRQPWGDGSASILASHHLDDTEKHNVSLRGELSFRITRGLSLNVGANASWVTDQIYLSARGEVDEEILLNLRTRASSFNYGTNIGFSYRFGSIYNNVVNNRFASAFGGFGFF